MTIITNWALIEKQGNIQITGQVVDHPTLPDGETITTNCIQFSKDNTIQTLSGSTYYLSKPTDPFEKQKLRDIQHSLPQIQLQQATHKGVIEDWAPTKTPNGNNAITGIVYGRDGTEDGTIIIVRCDNMNGRHISNGRSNYALGMPAEGAPPGIKETLIRRAAAAAWDEYNASAP